MSCGPIEDMSARMPITANDEQAGWSLRQWCGAIGVCTATFRNLPPELRPLTARLGKRVIIAEDPQVYLRRVAQAQNTAQGHTSS